MKVNSFKVLLIQLRTQRQAVGIVVCAGEAQNLTVNKLIGKHFCFHFNYIYFELQFTALLSNSNSNDVNVIS